MIGRSLLLSGLFALFGIGVIMRPAAKAYKVDETWLENQYPTAMGRYTMVPSQDGSKGHTYKMDATTYQTLKPYGIVGRTLTDGQRNFDVVTLAGDTTDSFHNPLQCFAAQEWTVGTVKEIAIPTKSRGMVRATIAEASRAGGTPQYALFTYEAPGEMCATNFEVGKDMLKAELKTGKIQFATFFRFMGLSPNITEAQMIEFAGDYLDASPVRPILSLKV